MSPALLRAAYLRIANTRLLSGFLLLKVVNFFKNPA